jgi:hypothetical protein
MDGPNKNPLREESNPDPFGADDAIDDTEDMSEAELSLKKTLSESRHRQSKNGDTRVRVQAVLPFPFYPNIRPLSSSDLESCVALEAAAFPDPHHRCTREKVGFHSAYVPSDVP